jgi:hypothetical protein
MIKPVKKLLGAAFLLAIASLTLVHPEKVLAQRFGVPACATCITPNNPTPGVPGSATSFTGFNPLPSSGSNSPRFRSDSGFNVSVGSNGGGHGGHHGRGFGYGSGYGVLYSYPMYVPTYDTQPEPAQPAADVPSGNALDREMWSNAAQRDPNATAANASSANTSTDPRNTDPRSNDPRYGAHYLDSREAAANAPAPTGAVTPVAPKEDTGPSIILVMRDGTRVELANYAIVGQNIFALDSAPRRKKIPLADLDLAATQKANDALGLDFKLPTR